MFIIRRGPNDVPQFFGDQLRRCHSWARTRFRDVRLAPYDVVYVPNTGIAEVFDFFNQYLQQFVPISWGFSYLVNPGTASNVVSAPHEGAGRYGA